MTIEEIRAEMRRKVVPENVIPQNIVEYLMDDSAELPELDAFTFLNRLRELGIGSADFEYLLEGCGAPAECVEKIKKNPAMNLQNLILTLESSGMTSHDYTIILYTARQIWERTLTLRIENTSAVADYVEINTDEEPEEEYQAPRMPKVADGYENAFPDEEEDAYEDEPDDEESKDDFDEPTLAEVLEQVKLLEKEMAYSGFDDEPEQTEEPAINYTEVKTGVSRRKDAELSYSEKPVEEPQSDFSGLASDFSKVFDKIKETKQAEREFDEEEDEPRTGTMSVTKILAGMQKNHGEEDAPDDEIEAEDAEIDPEEEIGNTSTLIKIDQTLFDKNEKTVKSHNYKDKDDYDYDEDYDEEYERKKPKPAKKSSKNYHIKSLIAAAVGAAALIAVSAVAFPAVKKAPEIFFAEKNEDIFTKIHKSYSSKIMGGETICEYSDTCEIFGDLLINKNGAMNFYDEKTVYAVTSEKISAESFDGTMLAAAKEILPPAKTSFVTAFQQDGALYCIFSGKKDGNKNAGKECGYMKVQNGTTLFTVRQDGALSDFSLKDGTIALGSVYVPNYTHSFSAEDTDVFLPRLGKDEKAPMSVENVAVSGTEGCSFAVCAEYKLDSGESSSAKAVLGNPISASADYRAAFNGKNDKEEYGLLISYKDEISTKKCEKIKAAAFGEDFAVTLEGENANIRTADFTAKRGLANFPEKAEQFKIIGKNLLVGNENGFFAAFDCTNPETPAALKLTKTNGIVQGDDAVLFTVDSGLTITYYNREGNQAKVAASYRKEFTPEELKTLRLKGAETTAFADGSCGAAYEYFDGVSVVAQYVVFGKKQGEKTLYDDKTGFTRAFAAGGRIYAISSKGFSCVSDNLNAEPDT